MCWEIKDLNMDVLGGEYNKISRGIKFTVYLVIYGVTRGSPLAELVRANSLLANTYSSAFLGINFT